MSKFYTPAWKERGTKFLKLIEAAADKIDVVKIHKKGRNTNNIFTREIEPKDWMSESGYATKVWSQDEKNTQDSKGLEKLSAAVINIPGNPKLIEVYQRKLLEFADLTPDEVNEIMMVEQQRQQQMQAMAQQAQMMGGQPGAQSIQARPNPPQQPGQLPFQAPVK